MNYKLIAYAQDFASFIIQNATLPDKISSIVLFGSVARGEATKQSDIDIFIETSSNIEKELEKLKEKFYASIKYNKYWGLLGIKNDFHIETGTLSEWQELEKSFLAQGITLFGKYKTEIKGNPYYLFSLEHGKNRSKNMSVWRKLYGYKQKANKKTYEKKGLIIEFGGEKIARGVFLIPSMHAQKIMLFLKNHKIKYKMHLFWKED